ncbi:MAG: radical SAM family heme chaperone HemW [Anaerolineaceae bacterium]|nr:radical SAM family heme chaperone HemW [Anaerolineaceae bacterium]
MEVHGVYLHFPFCVKRCLYCDFNTTTGTLEYLPEYVNAICQEIDLVASSLSFPLKIHTIYLGGGTPSLLSVYQIDQVLTRMRLSFDLARETEITLEANPGTVSFNYLFGLHQLGVNRLSLGIQSAVPAELTLMGRIHTVEEARQSIQDARMAGFDNFNLDFIYGLPGQTKANWQQSLDFAIENAPEHLSLYALTLDDHTPMARQIADGILKTPDDDMAADFYEMAMDQVAKAGYQQYEISNWATICGDTSRVCMHNMQYWHNQPYLGFGSGSHGYSQGVRTVNVVPLEEYIKRVRSDQKQVFPLSPANEIRNEIGETTRMQEAMMLGLRLTDEGIARSHYILLYQQDYYEIFHKEIDRLLGLGLLEWVEDNQERIRLTRKARLLGNQVFMNFVGDA